MPYSELMVMPMREDLVRIGVQELKTPEEVDAFLAAKRGTALLVVNSVCGCAAGAARPAVALAMQHDNTPDHVATVFAGQDVEATNRARQHFPDLPPTSPSFIIIKDGQPAAYMPRQSIEGRVAPDIATELMQHFDALTADGS